METSIFFFFLYIDILLRIFEKNAKKVKNEVTGTEKRRFWLICLKTLKKNIFWGEL